STRSRFGRRNRTRYLSIASEVKIPEKRSITARPFRPSERPSFNREQFPQYGWVLGTKNVHQKTDENFGLTRKASGINRSIVCHFGRFLSCFTCIACCC